MSWLEGWEEETLLKGLLFEDWVENEMETLNVTMDIGPEKVSVSEQEDMALGLEITSTESYATPTKTKTLLEHEAWGKNLINMIFQVEDFGPTICSTPSQELNSGLAFRGARTPPTLPLMPTQGQNQNLFSNPSLGLASATTSSSTPPQLLLLPRYKHTLAGNEIREMNSNFGMAQKVNLGLTMSPLSTSRKPKPMHFVKTHGIVPDGLVQTRLTQFRLLTNQGRGAERESKVDGASINGKTGKKRQDYWTRQMRSDREYTNFLHETNLNNTYICLFVAQYCQSIITH